MARFRRFRTYGRRAMRGYSFRRGRYGAKINIQFIGGAAAGYLAPEVLPFQTTALTAAAVLPIRLPYGIKMAAQGYVLGRLIKQFVPNPFGGTSGSGGDFA